VRGFVPPVAAEPLVVERQHPPRADDKGLEPLPRVERPRLLPSKG
jgi:hypothetical protein